MSAARSMLTVDETADELRISRDLVYRLCKTGEIPHRRFGRRVLIPRVVVDELTGVAMASSSLAPAGRVEDGVIGAPVPRDTGSALGEVSAANVGPSASGRTGAPTTEKGGRRTPTSLTTTPA